MINEGFLVISIGGYTGRSYRIERVDHAIKYTAWQYGYSDPKETIVEPTPEQWKSFWKVCKDIGIGEWEIEYPNPGVVDGTQWEINIQGDTFAASSSGDNAFPDDNDPEYVDYEERYGYPRSFRRFLLAVRRLIGWLPFE